MGAIPRCTAISMRVYWQKYIRGLRAERLIRQSRGDIIGRVALLIPYGAIRKAENGRKKNLADAAAVP